MTVVGSGNELKLSSKDIFAALRFMGNFKLSFEGQPIAHSQQLWNILGLYAVGLGAVLAGGCPLRQMIMAGQGSCDGAVTSLGMLVGAAFAHNFGLASAVAAAATASTEAVVGGPSAAGQIVLVSSATSRDNVMNLAKRSKRTAEVEQLGQDFAVVIR